MITKVVILTLSEKWGKKCIVAYDANSQRLLRLVSKAADGAGIDNCYVSHISLLDEVQIDILLDCPLEHQTENVLINLEHGFRKTGRSANYKLLDMLKNQRRSIFGNSNYKLADIEGLEHSIEIVQFDRMLFTNTTNFNGRPSTKVGFIAVHTQFSNYSVTDHNYFGHIGTINNGYAVISLPPSDSFTAQWGYFKYVSAIYED